MVLEVGSPDRSISVTWERGTCTLLGSTLDLLNQKRWGWGDPAICSDQAVRVILRH